MSKLEVKHLCMAIKEKYNLVEYVESKGIEIFNRGGRNFIVCPFHNDHDPSLLMGNNGKWDTWKCFGCKKSGSIIDFYSEFEKVSIGKAIAKLGNGIDMNFDLSKLVELFSKEEKESEETELDFINSMISTHCRNYLFMIKNNLSKEILFSEFYGVDKIYKGIDEAIANKDVDIVKQYYENICVNDYLLSRYGELENRD